MNVYLVRVNCSGSPLHRSGRHFDLAGHCWRFCSQSITVDAFCGSTRRSATADASTRRRLTATVLFANNPPSWWMSYSVSECYHSFTMPKTKALPV